MTCKDCLHFEVCDSGRHIGEYVEDDGAYTDGVEKECPMFKLGADVVPVVRCRDCKHCSKLEKIIPVCSHEKNVLITESAPTRVHMLVVDDYHYCSFGERGGDEK